MIPRNFVYISRDNRRMYGYKLQIENEPGHIKKRWTFVIYFHKWFKAWSNYPLKYII